MDGLLMFIHMVLMVVIPIWYNGDGDGYYNDDSYDDGYFNVITWWWWW